MYTKKFDPNKFNFLHINFTCPECAVGPIFHPILIPNPPQLNDAISENRGESKLQCFNEECNASFDAVVIVSSEGARIEIPDLYADSEISVYGVSDDTDEYELGARLSNTEYYSNFLGAIEDIRHLSQLKISESEVLNGFYYRMLYANLVTTLETYLSDAFLNTVAGDERLIYLFFRKYKGFSEKSLKYSDIPDIIANYKEIAKKEILSVVFHHLPKVSMMYQQILTVTFPDLGEISRIIAHRHDIVHRSGRNREGVLLEFDTKEINDAANKLIEFVQSIDEQIEID